jgi:hypothetical protein
LVELECKRLAGLKLGQRGHKMILQMVKRCKPIKLCSRYLWWFTQRNLAYYSLVEYSGRIAKPQPRVIIWFVDF